MSDVLIRDEPTEDIDLIRSAARERSASSQSYLRETLHAQAAYLRRQDALSRTKRRLRGRRPVRDDERAAVLDAVDAVHTDRAERR